MNKRLKNCYCFASDGYFIGIDSDYDDLLPNNSTYAKPEIMSGFVPHWDGRKWTQVEDHRGEKGYVAGQYTEIKDPGPLPEGWTTEYADPRAPEEIRAAEIKSRLEEIDRFVIRPMRAKLAGTTVPKQLEQYQLVRELRFQ